MPASILLAIVATASNSTCMLLVPNKEVLFHLLALSTDTRHLQQARLLLNNDMKCTKTMVTAELWLRFSGVTWQLNQLRDPNWHKCPCVLGLVDQRRPTMIWGLLSFSLDANIQTLLGWQQWAWLCLEVQQKQKQLAKRQGASARYKGTVSEIGQIIVGYMDFPS